MTNSNSQKFWDSKILEWENDKYKISSHIFGIIDVNASVKNRMNITKKIMQSVSKGMSVMELGCGSALLAEDIISMGAIKYSGRDFSKVAIEAANKRSMSFHSANKIDLKTQNINDLPETSADVCFSLGLFDWLSLEEIAVLNKKLKCKFFFHSFSEKRKWSMQQLFHRFYVYSMYGHQNNQYIPKYYSENEIIKTFSNSDGNQLRIYRSEKLSFGSIVYNLPFSVEELE